MFFKNISGTFKGYTHIGSVGITEAKVIQNPKNKIKHIKQHDKQCNLLP